MNRIPINYAMVYANSGAVACGVWVAWPAGGQPPAAPQKPVMRAAEKPDGEKPLSEQEAAAAFKEIGATVEFDSQGHVLSIEAAGDKLTDAVAGKLAACTSLESLDLGKSKISDAGLRAISGLASLQRLYLHDVPLTDNALVHLQGLSRLTCPFPAKHQGPRRRAGTGADPREAASRQSQRDRSRRRLVADLSGLAELDTLALENSKVTRAGLKKLKPLERLRVLNLNGCKIAGGDLNGLLATLPCGCSIFAVATCRKRTSRSSIRRWSVWPSIVELTDRRSSSCDASCSYHVFHRTPGLAGPGPGR